MEQGGSGCHSPGRFASSRGEWLAMVHSAIYDAVNAIQGSPTLYTAESAGAGASRGRCGGGGRTPRARVSLSRPADESRRGARHVPRAVRRRCRQDGGHCAGQVDRRLDHRPASHDGWDRFVTYDGGQDAGQWHATAPMYDVALLPQWADLDPFTMNSPSQFRPTGPPGLTSQAYADAFNEVKDLGGGDQHDADGRPDQIARFWADGAGTLHPAGPLEPDRRAGRARPQGNSLAENARLFAELNVALADAAIVAWDAKYAYNSWRPDHGDPRGRHDGNAGDRGRRRLDAAAGHAAVPRVHLAATAPSARRRPRSWPPSSATLRRFTTDSLTPARRDADVRQLQRRGRGGGQEPDLRRHPLPVLEPGRPGSRAERGPVRAATFSTTTDTLPPTIIVDRPGAGPRDRTRTSCSRAMS